MFWRWLLLFWWGALGLGTKSRSDRSSWTYENQEPVWSADCRLDIVLNFKSQMWVRFPKSVMSERKGAVAGWSFTPKLFSLLISLYVRWNKYKYRTVRALQRWAALPAILLEVRHYPCPFCGGSLSNWITGALISFKYHDTAGVALPACFGA